MRTPMLNNSIGMRIKENTGFGGTFYTWEISAWQGTIVQKKLATRSRGDSRFWAGVCVWFFVEFSFHCLVAQILLTSQSSSLVLLHHTTLATPSRLLLPKCCAWCTSSTKEASSTATCIWTGIICSLKSDLCCFIFKTARLENAKPPTSLNK